MFMATALPTSEWGGDRRCGWKSIQTRVDTLAIGIDLTDHAGQCSSITIHYGHGDQTSPSKAYLADAFREIADGLEADLFEDATTG